MVRAGCEVAINEWPQHSPMKRQSIAILPQSSLNLGSEMPTVTEATLAEGRMTIMALVRFKYVG